MPAKFEKSNAGTVQDPQLPEFNSDTLSSLTQRIESSLKKQTNGAVSKSSTPKPKKSKRKGEESNGTDPVESPKPRALPKIETNGKPQARSKRERGSALALNQGKKRSRDGKIKEPESLRNEGNVNSAKLGTRTKQSGPDEDVDMDEAMRALGGTKEDIDLFADAASDSELEGAQVEAARPDLKQELHQLIRQLGVDSVAQNHVSEISNSEEEEEVRQPQRKNKDQSKAPLEDANGVNLASQASKRSGKGSLSLVFPSQSEWHAVALPAIPITSQERNFLPLDLLDRVHKYAKSLLEKENEEYAAHSTSASSTHKFYSTIMSTGTLSDKISALTLSVQESPVHNMKALESLVGLGRKRSRGQAVEVLGALKDLFGPGNLLPSNRKLRTFASQPGLAAAFDPTDFHWTSQYPLPKPLNEIHLISWVYEDWLKVMFFEVLKIIETWCNDEVVFARGKAVDYVCQLLIEKPEQEANLLRLLVNKLGDSDKKIASKTSFNILQLETTHPLMKLTIIYAIESDILFRPGQSLHAKYYATITLNQTVLSGKAEGVARKLLDIYFSLFIKLLEKPEESKFTSTGANSITINRKGEVQGGGGSAGKKAQKKQVEKEKATTVDEDLREKMLSAVLTGVNRAIPFTNTNDESFEKHLDTLFKVTHSSNFNTSIQALMLIQQLNESHQGSVDRFYRTLYESLLDPRLLTSSKQALYLNLLFRALRSDLNVKRVKAFAKRLLQVVAMHQPSFTCGTLYLLRELEGVFANLEAFIDQPEEDNDDEEETYRDVQEATTNGRDSEADPYENAAEVTKMQKPQNYDGRKRDPEHSHAARSALWELTPFLTHYHPSVSLFATRLLTHDPMPPKPDLSLNTLIHFLDRFVYRNPKTTTTHKGASIMQPMAGGDSSALLISAYSGKERSRAPVNSEAFWRQESGKVGADEVFFHKYFSTLGRGKEKARKKKEDKKNDAEGSESGDGEDEDEIWKALVESRPELDEGSESGFSDMDGLESGNEDEDEGGITVNDDEMIEGSGNEGEAAKGGAEDEESLDFNDDDEALFDSDDEVPSDLEQAFEKEVQGGKKKPAGTAPSERGEKRGAQRRRLKSLPTFASAEDYAKMLNEDD